MEQPSPLTPEEIAELGEGEHARLGQPQAVKVFGILHIVFASLGLLSLAWTVFASAVGNPLADLPGASPAERSQAELEAALEERILPATVVSNIFTLVIAGLMLKAGIVLLKKRRDGLVWSNRYAWTSLAGKAVSLVMAFLFIIPAVTEMTENMIPDAAGLPSAGAMEAIVIGGTLVSILLGCVYPVLTLILLNRPTTKQWFAHQPE